MLNLTGATRGPVEVHGREMTCTRVFHAPRQLVFDAWRDPVNISHWWGPRGFRTTTEVMNFTPGGDWKFIMHGPDGTDHINHVIYREIEPPARIIYDHQTWPYFQMRAEFAEVGEGTELSIRMVFPDEAECRNCAEFGAVEGLDHTLAQLEEQLTFAQHPDVVFEIQREFAAPLATVYAAWTERDRLMRWFGPRGFTMFHAEMDFRADGYFHFGLRGPDDLQLWVRWDYREIVPETSLLYVAAFSTPDGGLGRHPLAPEWPPQMLYDVRFTDAGDKTLVTLRVAPFNATPDEVATFNSGKTSLQAGFGGTFDQLGDYLAGKR